MFKVGSRRRNFKCHQSRRKVLIVVWRSTKHNDDNNNNIVVVCLEKRREKKKTKTRTFTLGGFLSLSLFRSFYKGFLCIYIKPRIQIKILEYL